MADSDSKILKESVEFPSDLPPDQCISAVLEVRDYILDHDDGERDEIWEELVLNTNHPSTGRELCRTRGYVPKFRDWWWKRIVTPGLHALPDVEPIEDDEIAWCSV